MELGVITINDFGDCVRVGLLIIQPVYRDLVPECRRRNCFNFLIIVETEISVICDGVCYCIYSAEGLICWIIQYFVDTGIEMDRRLANGFLNSNGTLIVNNSMMDIFNSVFEFFSLGAGNRDGLLGSIRRDHLFCACPGATLLILALDVNLNENFNLNSSLIRRC